MTFFETLDRIKPLLPGSTPVETAGPSSNDLVDRADQDVSTKALVLDNEDTERTFVTLPMETASLHAEQFLTRLSGRLVGAETANNNGQLWTAGDLAFGLPSVAGGPLNWLHQERAIIGALTSATLIPGQQGALRAAAAFGSDDAHIAADSVVWSFLFPNETRTIRESAATGNLYYSMECISGQVQCYGASGCGAVMSYPDALHRTERACAHIRERAAARRFIDPIFQGAAVIVPPVRPGWSGAHLDLMRGAEKAMADPQVSSFAGDDQALVAQILEFVRTPR